MPDLDWDNDDLDEYADPWMNMNNGRGAVIAQKPVEVEEAPPPFTEAQIAFIEKMMEETIKRLVVAVDVGSDNNYGYSQNTYYRVNVELKYKTEDGPYNGEVISEGSDSFSVHIPEHHCERQYEY